MTAFILRKKEKKKKLNVPNSSSNELNDIRSVCQKMRKSLQNITPLLSTEQAFKHSDVFLHPLRPTTAPAFTLLEGTRRFCFKTHVVQSNVFYTKHVVWTSLSAKRSLSTRFWKPTPQPARPPPDHFIFSETLLLRFPPSAHRKEPRPNDTVRHPLYRRKRHTLYSVGRAPLIR